MHRLSTISAENPNLLNVDFLNKKILIAGIRAQGKTTMCDAIVQIVHSKIDNMLVLSHTEHLYPFYNKYGDDVVCGNKLDNGILDKVKNSVCALVVLDDVVTSIEDCKAVCKLGLLPNVTLVVTMNTYNKHIDKDLILLFDYVFIGGVEMESIRKWLYEQIDFGISYAKFSNMVTNLRNYRFLLIDMKQNKYQEDQ